MTTKTRIQVEHEIEEARDRIALDRVRLAAERDRAADEELRESLRSARVDYGVGLRELAAASGFSIEGVRKIVRTFGAA